MPINQPSFDSSNFSFGPGVLYMGPAGATPTSDIGAVRSGAQLKVTRELLEVMQGSPRTRVKQWAVMENVEFTITSIEWNLFNLNRYLGAGVTAGTAANAGSTISFGGDVNITESALLFKHVMPSGHTIDLYIWKAQPTGDTTITFGDEVHEFPITFRANIATTDWNSAALGSTQQLFRIRRFS